MSVSSFSGYDASSCEPSFYDTDSTPAASRPSSPTFCGNSRRSSDSSDEPPRFYNYGSPEPPSFLEKWNALSFKLLFNERFSMRWEARLYRMSRARLHAVLEKWETLSSKLLHNERFSIRLEFRITLTKIFAHGFLCAEPPAGKQHVLDRTLVACCTQQYLKQLPRCPFDRGKHLC
jgi:hypothetical protein